MIQVKSGNHSRCYSVQGRQLVRPLGFAVESGVLDSNGRLIGQHDQEPFIVLGESLRFTTVYAQDADHRFSQNHGNHQEGLDSRAAVHKTGISPCVRHIDSFLLHNRTPGHSLAHSHFGRTARSLTMMGYGFGHQHPVGFIEEMDDRLVGDRDSLQSCIHDQT